MICLINRFDTQLSDLVILDTSDFKEVAMVKLPLRVRPGLHGNFVERSSMVGLARCMGRGRGSGRTRGENRKGAERRMATYADTETPHRSTQTVSSEILSGCQPR